MAETDYPGIDYSLGDGTNADPATGIRYGVISTNAAGLTPHIWEDLEADYGDPACPKCGNAVADYDEADDADDYDNYRKHSCADYACETCRLVLGSDDVFGDEPVGHVLAADGYAGRVDSDGDLFLTKAPYYTHAQFCSPCAPGAGHLENPCPSGPKTYCLGHDWFEAKAAPYPVYAVDTNEEVTP